MTLSISVLPKFSGPILLNTLFEQIYLSLVYVFYANLSFENNVIFSRISDLEIKIHLEVFARILHLSCESVDIYDHTIADFDYPDNESPFSASRLLHCDNLALVKNEEVKYFTIITQILVKIIFYNFFPKLGEYSHTRGCAPPLIYCLL